MSEIIFYTNPQSRGRIVRWMLEECGVQYRTEIVAYGPQMKTPPYTDINLMGKVPALVHGCLRRLADWLRPAVQNLAGSRRVRAVLRSHQEQTSPRAGCRDG
jgi:hypothetical protein